MQRLVCFLLICVVLAGCTEEEPTEAPPTSAECLEQGLILGRDADDNEACIEAPFVIEDFEDPNHYCVVNEDKDRVHAPDLVGNPWELGQYWTYALVIDGESAGETKLVYYDNQDIVNGEALHYMIGTPTRDEALHHAIFGENPMIGRIHRVLYSPHESGDHANMFNFPLCAGSSWSTIFYGEEFSLSAKPVTLIDVPGHGEDDGFLIEGSSPDGSTLSLSYSPAAQWFTFIELERTDGSGVEMTLAEVGTSYSGDAFFLRGQQDDFRFLATTELAPGLGYAAVNEVVTREDGSEGAYDTIGMHIVAGRTSATSSGTITITAPDGTEVWRQEFSPTTQENAVDDILEVPFQSGDWTISLTGLATDTSQAYVFAHVSTVSIYDRSGAL